MINENLSSYEVSAKYIKYELDWICRITASNFWKKKEEEIRKYRKEFEPDTTISIRQAVSNFGCKLYKITKENGLRKKVSCFNEENNIVVTLEPYSVRSYIDMAKGIFCISAPHIYTEQFDYTQWRTALQHIQDIINIDLSPLEKEIKIINDKFYLNAKAAEIVKNTIMTLCQTISEKKHWRFQINQKCLKSEIILNAYKNHFYYIEIFHKPFSVDSNLLISLLNNPHEEELTEKVTCRLIKADSTKLKKALKSSFEEAKRIMITSEEANK